MEGDDLDIHSSLLPTEHIQSLYEFRFRNFIQGKSEERDARWQILLEGLRNYKGSQIQMHVIKGLERAILFFADENNSEIIGGLY